MEESGVFFHTFGGFKDKEGYLILDGTEKSDVFSLREFLNPGKYVENLKPDFDLIIHRVRSPEDPKQSLYSWSLNLPETTRKT